jgi:hypothetical protein
MKQEISPVTVIVVVGALIAAIAIGLFMFQRAGAGPPGRTAEEVGLGEPVQPGMPEEAGAPAGPAGPAGR